jgi:hypothetical protein
MFDAAWRSIFGAFVSDFAATGRSLCAVHESILVCKISLEAHEESLSIFRAEISQFSWPPPIGAKYFRAAHVSDGNVIEGWAT